MEVRLLRYTPDGVNLVAEASKITTDAELGDNERVFEMLINNDYGSALEHIVFTFELRDISIALSRELLEHRIASHTARSTRYCDESSFGYYIPKRLMEKYGMKGEGIYRKVIESAIRNYTELYNALLEMGYSKKDAREVARYALPMAKHTTYIWTINLRSLINFLGLRLCVRSAPEMRELAEKVKACVSEVYPVLRRIGCRGVNLGVCPENEARPKECPYRNIIPTKKELKARE